MADSSNVWKRRAGAGLVALAILAGLAWLFAPGTVGPRSAGTEIEALDPSTTMRRRKVERLAAFTAKDEPVPLEEDPSIPVVTPNCKLLVSYERRHVPQFTILDTIRDGAMRFDEDDLSCLTAAGVSPAVLDLAEARIDYNKLRGIKGKPGKDLTREHWTYLEHPSNPANR